MGEIFASIADSIQKRTTSSFLGSLSLFWIMCHYQSLVVLFFVDERLIYNKFKLLKNEYIFKFFYTPFFDPLIFIGNVLPIILTILFVWILPKYVLIYAFKAERDHKLAKQKIVYENEEVLQKYKKDLLTATEKKLDVKQRVQKKKNEINKLDPKVAWKDEYEKFRDKLDNTEDLLSILYDNNGWVSNVKVSRRILALYDSLGLIDFNEDRSQISLTEKGKYFINNYLKDIKNN